MTQTDSINRDYIKSYCASYTNNILDTAFKDGPYLLGNDLKQLCNPEQVNYNLIKAIFLQWEAQINKMKNPYFDHDAPAVQNALRTYMQVLSRHIKLDKGSLRPLLQQAAEETIYQVFCPVYYFENFLWPQELGSLKLSELSKLHRFVKINEGFLSELISQLENDHANEIEPWRLRDRLKGLSREWENRWEPVDSYAKAFSKVVALHSQSLWQSNQISTAEEQDESLTKNVNQQYTKEVLSLNDKLHTKQVTLADKLNEKVDKVENLRKSLNINQKFRFINELYGGNSNEFNSVLDKIDQCGNYQEAISILNAHSSRRSQWDMEDEVVIELMVLVSRRFSEPGPAFDARPSSAE